MIRNAVWLAVVATMTFLIAGCDSRESQAAAACESAAKARAEGKLLAVDLRVLAASAENETADILRLKGPVTFDTGLQSEYTQTLDCRVQVSDGQVRVIAVSYVF